MVLSMHGEIISVNISPNTSLNLRGIVKESEVSVRELWRDGGP